MGTFLGMEVEYLEERMRLCIVKCRIWNLIARVTRLILGCRDIGHGGSMGWLPLRVGVRPGERRLCKTGMLLILLWSCGGVFYSGGWSVESIFPHTCLTRPNPGRSRHPVALESKSFVPPTYQHRDKLPGAQ